MADKSMPEKETIPIEEAKREVEMTARRIGLLYLSFARTLVDDLGEEEGKRLILKAIKYYGKKIGERTRKNVIDQGLDPVPENAAKGGDIPKFGMLERTETVEVGGEKRMRGYGCAMAKVWKEYGEEKLGRLYCYVDPAKYMTFNPEFKLVHSKALPDGDDYCELVIRPTTEQEREDFLAEDKDWSYIDKAD